MFMTAAGERLRELVDSCEAPDLPPLSEELVRTLDLPADLPAELAIGEVALAVIDYKIATYGGDYPTTGRGT